jgi:hypothetical protein
MKKLRLFLLLAFLSCFTGQAHAAAWWIMTGGSGSINTSLATWDEDSVGWGDTANTHIVRMIGGAGADDVGVGVATGADLVWSETGNIAASTGSPPYRQFQADDYESITQTLAGIISGSTWTIIIKLADWTTAQVNESPLFLSSTAPASHIRIYKGTGADAHKLWFYVDFNGVSQLSVQSPSASPTSGNLYVAIWYDGTTIRGGYSTAKPSKLSDFTWSDGATKTFSFAADEWNSLRDFGGSAGEPFVTAKFYYVILSKSCLIDNGS